jgi:hypothetical protein
MNATMTDAKLTATHPFWSVAMADIMIRDARPEQAAENMFKRVEEIFAKYPIKEG